MLQFLNTALKAIDDLVWGVPLIVLILATGIYLTVRLKGMQIRKLPAALRYMVQNEEEGSGEVTSFGALCTAMSATIGTGNIVGVATAIVAGEPGALFWMWIAALFGMATKYAEGVLAICYRSVDKETGHVLGVAPFTISKTEWERNGDGWEKYLLFLAPVSVFWESEPLLRLMALLLQ